MGWIPSAISAGLSIYSAIKGRKGSNEEQEKAMTGTDALISDLRNKNQEFSPATANFMRTSQDSFQPAINFWAPLLGGSRQAATETLAPEISRTNDQYNQILQNTQGERSGAGASIYAAAPYQRQGQIQSIYSGLRPKAAESMANIGSQTGQLGTQTLYAIISALGQALGGQGLMANMANTKFGQQQQAGSAFWGAMQNVMQQAPQIYNGIKGSSTGGSNTISSGGMSDPG
jgi:hypothetical protein